jgi:hypothetical protein
MEVSRCNQRLLSMALLVRWAIYGKPAPLVTHMRRIMYRPVDLALRITIAHYSGQVSCDILRFVFQTCGMARFLRQPSRSHPSHRLASHRMGYSQVGRILDMIRVLATPLKMPYMTSSHATLFTLMTSMNTVRFMITAIVVTVTNTVNTTVCRQRAHEMYSTALCPLERESGKKTWDMMYHVVLYITQITKTSVTTHNSLV